MNLLNDAVADVSGLFYDFRRSCISEKLEYYRPSRKLRQFMQEKMEKCMGIFGKRTSC